MKANELFGLANNLLGKANVPEIWMRSPLLLVSGLCSFRKGNIFQKNVGARDHHSV
jgi:hypothetical protein